MTAPGTAPALRYTGASVKRLEDPRLLTGRARYIDDLVLPRMLSVAFVRSPHAHARIGRIDPSAARALPGVVAVVTPDELLAVTRPLAPRVEGGGFEPTAWPALADGVARFSGEAVAAVVAINPTSRPMRASWSRSSGRRWRPWRRSTRR
jgi:carbon-monoxide dehydrogenase large subunit